MTVGSLFSLPGPDPVAATLPLAFSLRPPKADRDWGLWCVDWLVSVGPLHGRGVD